MNGLGEGMHEISPSRQKVSECSAAERTAFGENGPGGTEGFGLKSEFLTKF